MKRSHGQSNAGGGKVVSEFPLSCGGACRRVSEQLNGIRSKDDVLGDKQTHPVDCRATSSTTQEWDSLKSQGRGCPRGPTWRLGISADVPRKVATSRPADRRKRTN
uniref:Uncharacterized protein n=1 Tax=Brassica oleracea var. oleracea TaxID=109376 RepID=A0A0D3C0Y7_BRAOL